MSTLQATRIFSIFVFSLLGIAILIDGLTEAEDAVASPMVGGVMLGSSIFLFVLPKILR